MKRRILSILLATVMTLSLAACAGSKSTNEKDDSDTLTVAIAKEPAALVPYESNDTGSTYLYYQIYDRLLDVDEDMNLKPGLAKSWEVLDDTHYRFCLRDDVYFHNGEKMTADDVLYTFAQNSTSSATATTIGPVDIENSYAEDDNTVVIALTKPYPGFLKCCAIEIAGIVCKSAMEKDPEGYAEHPIGTGPFEFVKWASGDYIELKTNENWWGGKINFKTLKLRYIPEATTRTVEAQSGGVDIAQITVTDVNSLNSADGLTVLNQPTLNTSYLSFNCSIEPFNNVKVRQAISMAIDTKMLVKASYFGYCDVAKSFLPSMIDGYYDAETEYQEYNVKKAKQLLKEAGYPDGFSCTLISNARQSDAEMIQAYLSEIGIDVKLNITDFSNWLDALVNGKQQMYIGGWTVPSGDASEAFAVFNSQNFGSGGNRSYYSNEQADELLNVIDTEMNTEKRKQACVDLQKLLATECVTIGLNAGSNFYAYRSDIKGFEVLPTQSPNFTKITFEE